MDIKELFCVREGCSLTRTHKGVSHRLRIHVIREINSSSELDLPPFFSISRGIHNCFEFRSLMNSAAFQQTALSLCLTVTDVTTGTLPLPSEGLLQS